MTADKKFIPPRQNITYAVGGVAHGVDEQVLATIKQDVEKRINARELEVPALPIIAQKILQVSNDPSAGMEEIQKIVQNEPFLAGKVLSLVNSAFHSGRKRVTSLRQALVLLGLKTLQDIVFSISLHQKVFKAKRYLDILEENWAHSVGTATACGLIAESIRTEKENAFLCGLLHDIGRPVLLHSIVQIEETTLSGREIGPDNVVVILDDFHELIGGYVSVKWKLSQNMIDSIKHHHHPSRSREYQTLASIVYCGDRIARHIGFGSEPHECDFRLDRVFHEIKLTDEDVLRRIVETTREQGRSLLAGFQV